MARRRSTRGQKVAEQAEAVEPAASGTDASVATPARGSRSKTEATRTTRASAMKQKQAAAKSAPAEAAEDLDSAKKDPQPRSSKKAGVKRKRPANPVTLETTPEEVNADGHADSNTATTAKEELAVDDDSERPQKVKRTSMVAYSDESTNLVRSVPASGRWWKKHQVEKNSMQIYKANPKTLSTSWEKKMALRKKRETIKDLEAQLKAQRDEDNRIAREKRAAKKKRKAENELKNARVQVLRNTEKIKKMSKKQLRMVKKTEVDEDGNVRLVPLYSR
mmetsp:Transcript_2436/g.6167  ORF Transcript_2436/g.6167 Transcript_2436/m.6167 type:complete len:277 (+) Transcript_2436:50-880(+)